MRVVRDTYKVTFFKGATSVSVNVIADEDTDAFENAISHLNRLQITAVMTWDWDAERTGSITLEGVA